MSVLIKRMQMPKSCMSCCIGQYDYEYNRLTCQFVGGILNNYWKERNPECPLIEVKDECTG